jgi:hypothetical protein
VRLEFTNNVQVHDNRFNHNLATDQHAASGRVFLQNPPGENGSFHMFRRRTLFYFVLEGMCLDKMSALQDESSDSLNIHAPLHSRDTQHSIAQAKPDVLG